ncbi:ATP-binding protein [Sphingomonas sp. RB1R13]|uniref:ATP-binding protein n=1 Tax=Sphingomonas sp. RB1R13 TaxID=3096159 RepID=UPI002FCB4F5D
MNDQLSERALILAPGGRDAGVAAAMLGEAGIAGTSCTDAQGLVDGLQAGAGFALVTEESLMRVDLHRLSQWINAQPEWSDLPFIVLTQRGGLERNPAAGRLLELLGNVTFLERPFHLTTLISVARSALRARRRQYEARARLVSLQHSKETLRQVNETLEARVDERTREHERAMAQLHEAQKLETLGQLTGGVAHDFNNLLTPVIGNLDLLRRRFPDDPRAQRLIDGGLQAASRAATLVQRLLAFARRQDLQPRPVAIPALLEGMSDMLARSLGPTIDVHIAFTPDLPAARVDPNQLELALLNLAINARDAMPDGGPLRIEASAVDRRSLGALSAGHYIRIAVIDGGLGMDRDTLARAVEPFFSTKGVGKGTGLGLSMVHGLAAQLGGMLTLTSTPGQGTTAEILLPTTTEQPGETEHDSVVLQEAVVRATILLVDDEELVRNGTADMLRDIGYEVLAAASGAEALMLLRSGTEINLLVTDYLMPGMNGVDLVQAAGSVVPGLPALLITGYSNIASGPGAALPRLAKPFRQVDLAARVAELLVQRSADVVPIRSDRRNQP